MSLVIAFFVILIEFSLRHVFVHLILAFLLVKMIFYVINVQIIFVRHVLKSRQIVLNVKIIELDHQSVLAFKDIFKIS